MLTFPCAAIIGAIFYFLASVTLGRFIPALKHSCSRLPECASKFYQGNDSLSRNANRRLRAVDWKIPADLPLVVQISRFDPWKDPKGVVEAFKLANQEVDARLVLLGNFATDDSEGEEIFNSLCACRSNRILILTSGDDTSLVNALRMRAAVVLQKSLREGFGLTVAEGMWKSRAVIGGNVGGIRLQIEDTVNGFLVSSNKEAAERIVQLLRDKQLREEMGRRGHETVRKNFLLTRYAEQYLDLFSGFDDSGTLKNA